MIKPNKQKTIGIVEVRSFRCPPAKHIDLLPQDQDFCFQFCSRLKERSQDAKNQLEQISHQAASLSRLFSASMLNLIFGTHSRSCLFRNACEAPFHLVGKHQQLQVAVRLFLARGQIELRVNAVEARKIC